MTHVHVRGEEERNPQDLNEVMDFDRVIRVHADGTVSYERTIYGPELFAGELSAYGGRDWRLMNGYSSQDSYAGPLMHSCESVGAGMGRDILATPGLYVSLVDTPDDDGEAESWAVAYCEA